MQFFNRIYLALFCKKNKNETSFTAPDPFMYRYITPTKHGYKIEFYDGSNLVGSKFRTHKQLLFNWQDLRYCLQSSLNSRFVLIIRESAFDRCLKLYTRFFDCQRQHLIEISQKTEAEILWSYFLAQDLLSYRFNAHNYPKGLGQLRLISNRVKVDLPKYLPIAIHQLD
ncbi:MAG: hypothetical protein KME09_01035 [Pleurocapsa minor HA4230-MV1]|jgi:hypothetical protein|nr:hypothetical protein [Pleurocapsa minor HA4230-MV1]